MNELKEIEGELKELEIQFREANNDYEAKDVIARAAEKDADEACIKKDELFWELLRQRDRLDQLKQEVMSK